MKNIFYYLIIGLIFGVYKILYTAYFGHIMAFTRTHNNISDLLMTFLFLLPLIILILLIILSFKFGLKHCIEWNRKSKIITIIIVVLIQILPSLVSVIVNFFDNLQVLI